MLMEKKSNTFGENLRRLRLEQGLTQTELGNKVGLSKRMIAHYEKHVKMPATDKLALLAKVLSTNIDSLLFGDTKELIEHNSDPSFSRKLEKAKKLPESDKNILSSMIDTLLKKNDLNIKKPRKKL